MESVLESKESLRLRMKVMRESLGPEKVSSLSLQVSRRLLESPLLGHLMSVALYASVRHEVSTEEIFEQLRKNGCRTFLPRVTGERVEFVETTDWKALTPGPWGVPEPRNGEPARLSGIQAVLIPGLAFDEAGGRLGFGKGYYDRALGTYQGRKIGLAYDFQVFPTIPRTEADLVCDWIVTDKRVVRGAAMEEFSWNPNL